jgi:hypothetical protein
MHSMRGWTFGAVLLRGNFHDAAGCRTHIEVHREERFLGEAPSHKCDHFRTRAVHVSDGRRMRSAHGRPAADMPNFSIWAGHTWVDDKHFPVLGPGKRSRNFSRSNKMARTAAGGGIGLYNSQMRHTFMKWSDSKRTVVLLSCLLACNGASSDGASPDGASPDFSAEAGDESEVSAPETSPDGPSVPEDVPSKQKVTFVITNQGTTDRFLVLDGQACTGFGVSRLSGTTWVRVALRLLADDESCGCDGYGCDDIRGPTVYQRLAPGAQSSIVWDARELTLWQEELDCPYVNRTWTLVRGVHRPVAPGQYRVDIPNSAAPERDCWHSATDLDRYQCAPGGMIGPGVENTCGAEAQVTQEFTLPATGDITVGVDLDMPAAPCNPATTWNLSYGCPELWDTPDTVTLAPDGDGGMLGTVTQHLPAGVPGVVDSGVVVDLLNCKASVFAYSNWQVSGAPYCDLREVEVFFHSGGMPTLYTRCDGHEASSTEALHLMCDGEASPM